MTRTQLLALGSLAFFTMMLYALVSITLIKAVNLGHQTKELQRQVDEQRAQLAVHTKALNELYGRDGK